ncbi:MAG: ATP-dependent DNA helicase [Bacilli bacterium]|nr:ATP-dependent DNA helicase [Bacilli bacterium]
MAMNYVWRDDKEKLMFDKASSFVDAAILDIAKKRRLGFSYRKNQHMYAKDIMEAIRNKNILLIQAEVGIGKSFGYLIPVFSSFKNVDYFEKVIISTSTIALQNQLLGDIERLNKFLGMNLKAEIAKGINNYVCIKNMEELANSTSDNKTKELLRSLEKEIYEKNTTDKAFLNDIPDRIWKKIQMKSRGECSNCVYSRRCLFKHHVNEVEKADIVITNHSYFTSMVRKDNNFISNADMYIFDEAHDLEDAIRSINEKSIQLYDIQQSILYFENNGYVCGKSFSDKAEKLIESINVLFRRIMQTSSGIYKNANNSLIVDITDCDKIPVYGNKFVGNINSILKELGGIIKILSNNRNVCCNKEASSVLKYLNYYFNLFFDMKKGIADSNNIYWANFYKNNKINLGYVKKEDVFTTNSIFGKNIPVLCTSATMLDSKGSYNTFKNSVSLDKFSSKDRSVIDGRAYSSSFDYEKNSIVYYDSTVSNPNNYDQYVSDLADRIIELIRITDGRSLILFTSKATMKSVYDIVAKEDFGFKLLMQGQYGVDNSTLCKEFEKDVHSCLFSTGLWEGIDVKGESLSNVIITRLPFPVVDAVTEAKACKYSSKDAYEEVYENAMLKKLAQAMGRLIRNKTDVGSICILDSRVVEHFDGIKNCTPYVRFTDNINDIIKFFNKKVNKLVKKIV